MPAVWSRPGTEDDAIAIANDSAYGLVSSVWTTNVPHGIDISQKIRTDTYEIDCYAFDPGSPFGGYKNSGIGRKVSSISASTRACSCR
jgi:aldehyde dehydrogenase (NAD+)